MGAQKVTYFCRNEFRISPQFTGKTDKHINYGDDGTLPYKHRNPKSISGHIYYKQDP